MPQSRNSWLQKEEASATINEIKHLSIPQQNTMLFFLLLTATTSYTLVTSAPDLDNSGTTTQEYKDHMSHWIKHQLNTIDQTVPPQKWHDTLHAPLNKGAQTPDAKTVAHLRALHDTRNRLRLVDTLFGTGHVETLHDQLEHLRIPGATTLLGDTMPSCCATGNFNPQGGQECTETVCDAWRTQFSERLMSDLNSAETYIADQQEAQKAARASSLLADRIFSQASEHEERSTKPVLPGVFVIGQGYSLPRGATSSRYFEINTLNIERNLASSEMSGTWSIPGSINVIPIHQYQEPRIQVYSNMRQYSRVQQERLGIVTGRGVLLHGRDAEHLQRTFNRAQVLVEIRLYVTSYRITMADNVFVRSKVGTRDELRSVSSCLIF